MGKAGYLSSNSPRLDFRFREPIPQYGITSNSLLRSEAVTPWPGDLVVCPANSREPQVYIGKFARQIGKRTLLELPDGTFFLVFTDNIYVVTDIEE
jgi:hypothetical protein